MQPNRKQYIDGNTVRRLQPVPKSRPAAPSAQPKVTKQTRRNRERALSFGKGYTTLLVLAVCVTLGTCVTYLSVQAQVTKQAKNIASKQKELNSILDENSATLERLNSSIDLKYIYKVATKELGMVYPEKDQVITYDSTNYDYVRQYSDIPTDRKK